MDTTQFYAPVTWEIEIWLGKDLLVSDLAPQGHHLARAAHHLLMLFTGVSGGAFGMLNPDSTRPITLVMHPAGTITTPPPTKDN